jgi:hypothetical protein
MRRFTILTICLLVLSSLVTTTAWAGPHYQKNAVSAAIQSNGNLIVSWEEAGLGFTNIDYSLTADVTAQFFCRTKSGSIPNANNKHVVNTPTSTNGSFEPKNGKVTASLTLVAPPAPVNEPPTCGSGQSLDLQSITYTNVVLTDTSNNVSINVTRGTFSLTLFAAP